MNKNTVVLRGWDIRDEMFKAHLSFFLGDYKVYARQMIKLGVPEEIMQGDPLAAAIKHENMFSIFMREVSIPELVHELTHNTINVFADRGVDVSDTNQEVMAYYMEMMTRLVLEAVKKKPDVQITLGQLKKL